MDKPCDRCNSGGGWSNNDESSYSADVPPYCAEVQLGFGIISWLCLDCRKSFRRLMLSDSLMTSHAMVSLKLDFWKTRVHHTTPDSYLEAGLNLLSELESIESLVNDNVIKWLSSNY